ncbi:MAG: carbohydrate-binding protein [Elusimicrobia bacterium]|nr:carbohydrate-binding protein [Elusimicrobiota bacterium]
MKKNKSVLFFTAFLIGAFIVNSMPVFAAEKLVNTGFEDWEPPQEWVPYGGSAVTSDVSVVHSGSRSCQVIDVGGTYGSVRQLVTGITGNNQYDASGWIYIDSDSTCDWAELRVYFYETADGSGSNIGRIEARTEVKDRWVYVDIVNFHAPENAQSAYVHGYIHHEDDLDGIVYCDDFSLDDEGTGNPDIYNVNMDDPIPDDTFFSEGCLYRLYFDDGEEYLYTYGTLLNCSILYEEGISDTLAAWKIFRANHGEYDLEFFAEHCRLVAVNIPPVPDDSYWQEGWSYKFFDQYIYNYGELLECSIIYEEGITDTLAAWLAYRNNYGDISLEVFVVAAHAAIQPGDIVINEFIQDPVSASDTYGEWVELYNMTGSAINLEGCVIRDDGSNSHTVGAVSIPANGYLLMGKSTDPALNGGAPVQYTYGSFSLGNTSDQIVFLNPEGLEIDRVNYDSAAGWPLAAGKSLELNSPGNNNADPDNWHQATTPYGAGDMGTPGLQNGNGIPVITFSGEVENALDLRVVLNYRNSQYPELSDRVDSFLFEEEGVNTYTFTNVPVMEAPYYFYIVLENGNGQQLSTDYVAVCGSPAVPDNDNMREPVIRYPEGLSDGSYSGNDFVPLNSLPIKPGDVVINEFMQDPTMVSDTTGEWVELYNKTAVAIDLAGCVIKDDGSNTHTIGAVSIPANGYLVMGRSTDTAANGGAPVQYVYGTYSLVSTDDEIVLLNPQGVEIDRVNYDSSAGWPIVPGRSAELVHMLEDNSVASNWHESMRVYGLGDYGTPGAYNGGYVHVHNHDADNIGETSARLGGYFEYRVPQYPVESLTVRVYYGRSDGGTDPGAWEYSDSVSPDQGDLYYNAEDLLPGTQYYYRWYASYLGIDIDWADEATSFTTGGTPPPVVSFTGEVTAEGGSHVGLRVVLNYRNSQDPELSDIVDSHVFEDPDDRTYSFMYLPVMEAPYYYYLVLSKEDGTQLDYNCYAACDPPASADNDYLREPIIRFPEGLEQGIYDNNNFVPESIVSIHPGDIVINEFISNPAAVSDTLGEWVELYNPSNNPVNLTGSVIRDNGSSVHTISGLTIPAQDYLVLGRSTDTSVNGGVAVDYIYGSFSLGNTADQIVLKNPQGVEIDRVDYDGAAGWPLEAGKSAELSSPAADNNNPANWQAAEIQYGAGDYGTPGEENGAEVNPVLDLSGRVEAAQGLQVEVWTILDADPELNEVVYTHLFEEGDTYSFTGPADISPWHYRIILTDGDGGQLDTDYEAVCSPPAAADNSNPREPSINYPAQMTAGIYGSNDFNIAEAVLPVPVLAKPEADGGGPGDYLVEWICNGGDPQTYDPYPLYELQEDDNADFTSPALYWPGNNSYEMVNKPAGTYYYRVRGWTAAPESDGQASGWSNIENIVVEEEQEQGPYGGTAWAVPGTIQGEDYDEGGEGIAYHDSDGVNEGGEYRSDGVDIQVCSEGGYNIGWMYEGEWIEYTVNVLSNGVYNMKLRMSSGVGGAMHVEMDGTDISGQVSVPDTGGWENWMTVEVNGISLNAGEHVMRVCVDASAFNMNYICINSPEDEYYWGYIEDMDIESEFYEAYTLMHYHVQVLNEQMMVHRDSWDPGPNPDVDLTYSMDLMTGVITHEGSESSPGDGDYSGMVSGMIGIVDLYIVYAGRAGLTSGQILQLETLRAYLADIHEPQDVLTVTNGTGATDITAVSARLNGTLVSLGTPPEFPNVRVYWGTSDGGTNESAWQHFEQLDQVDIGDFYVDLNEGNEIILEPETQYYYRCYAVAAEWGDEDWADGTESFVTLPQGTGQSPYGGTAWAIPGKIEAENYDLGGDGVAYMDTTLGNEGGAYRSDNVDIQECSDTGGGYNVGWIDNGEWLEYTVNVSQSGSYDVSLRVASGMGGTMHIEMDGAAVTGQVNIPDTGGWSIWNTVHVSGISLQAGEHVMKLFTDVSAYNLNYIDFTLSSEPDTITLTGSVEAASGLQVAVWTILDQDHELNEIVYSHLFEGADNTYTFSGPADISPWHYRIILTDGNGGQLQNDYKAVCDPPAVPDNSDPREPMINYPVELTGGTYGGNDFEIVSTGGQTPYGGTAWAIPGKIEAENYDLGGDEVAYMDTTQGNEGGAYRSDNVDIQECSDTGGGYNVGWIDTGEWLEYTVNVAETGEYKAILRVASGMGGVMHVELDGAAVTGQVNIPNTGSWGSWQTVEVGGISLTAGQHVMRLAVDTSAFNINYLEFEAGLISFTGEVQDASGLEVQLWKNDPVNPDLTRVVDTYVFGGGNAYSFTVDNADEPDNFFLLLAKAGGAILTDNYVASCDPPGIVYNRNKKEPVIIFPAGIQAAEYSGNNFYKLTAPDLAVADVDGTSQRISADGSYIISWADLRKKGVTGYELLEDDNPDFTSPKYYWCKKNRIRIKNKPSGIYYYKARSYYNNAKISSVNNDEVSEWSKVFSMTVNTVPGAPDKDNLKVFPVPYKPYIHTEGITFRGWRDEGDVKIYNICGEHVATVEKTDDITDGVVWKDTPDEGRKPEDLASGVYIYIINDRVTGKIAIIR